MDPPNQTSFNEFILIGFPLDLKICILFFIVLLIIFFFTVMANVLLIVSVIVNPKLHLPMYFFLCNLSFLDVCYSSTSIPKAFVDIFSTRRTISVTACMIQMNVFTLLGGTESLLLAVMAYDRYVAISFPLHYNVIMNWRICRNIIILIGPGNFFISVVPFISRPLIFCTENKLDHFVCEMLAVLELACGNIAYYKITIFVASIFTLIFPPLFILVSYILILSSISKIHSSEGRSKAFSTCGSHLTVVSMFYGASVTMYMGQTHFSSILKYFSLIYGAVTPLLNPLIYSLRNSEVKKTILKIFTTYSLQGMT